MSESRTDSVSNNQNGGTGESEDSKAIDYVGGASWAIATSNIFILLFCWSVNSSAGESRWIVPLFALPLIAQTIGSAVLFHRPRGDRKLKTFHRFYLWMMILCIWSYHGLWFAYNKFQLKEFSLNPRFFSGAALVAITVLVGLVVMMTLAIMCPSLNSNELRGGRLRKRFSRMIRSLM